MSRDEGMVDVHFKIPSSYRDSLDSIMPDGKMRSVMLRRLVRTFIEEYKKGESPDASIEAAKQNVERLRKEGG